MNDNRRGGKERNNRPERRPERRADRFAERQQPVEEVEGQIEGRNAVTEALKAGRTIDKVFVAEGDTDRSLQRLAAQAKEAGAVIVPVDRRKLDQMSTTRSPRASLRWWQHMITIPLMISWKRLQPGARMR